MLDSKCLLCIRREDKNKWEKRTPLIPSHAIYLKNKYGVNICVQSSKIRIFKDSEYRKNQIKLVNDIKQCSIILALKEIPLDLITENKIYLFFSHTTKGQPHNMLLLRKLKQLNCTLIDYEKITDQKGRRLIFFGIQAGQSGMIETLYALRQKLNEKDDKNPFYRLKQPFEYNSLDQAKEEIKKIGTRIEEKGLNTDLTPLVCGFSGYGNTAKGAQEIFDILPHQEIKAQNLEAFINSQNYKNNRLYKVVFKEKDMVEPINDTHKFRLQDYYKHPEKYQSKFSNYLPYLTILVNCIYWEPKYPKLIRISDLKTLFNSNQKPHLKVIGDISFEINGSIECTKFSMTPDNPFYIYDPLSEKVNNESNGRGVAVMSIDNLPAEIPYESSVFFSKALKPFIPGIVNADFSHDFNNCNLPGPVKKAVILYKGEFTADYKYMEKFI
ncbi:MAG: hypothetical protein ACQERH_03550 [Acidobacteriota bacterium]